MNIEKKEFLQILEKYLNGEASAEEERFLHAYYNLFDTGKDILQQFDPAAKQDLKDSIHNALKLKLETEPVRKQTHRLYYLRIAAASAAVLVLVSFIYYLYQGAAVSPKQPRKFAGVKAERIVPGGNKALLTLADGSTIVLDSAGNGTLARLGNAKFNKSADGQLEVRASEAGHAEENAMYSRLNVISTPRGGQYRLTLPDGSQVWLNSASSVRFPLAFKGNERKVEITGEAYFEVTPDKSKPFRVVSNHQTIEVLGTHFNVNAYDDEGTTKTTLLEGSVKVISGPVSQTDGNNSVIIKPGQQSQLKGNSFSIVSADLEGAVAWKNGYFKFDKESIQYVMRQISRWYDVDIEYRGEISRDELVGKINRTAEVSGVLRVLKLGNVNCRIEGRKIIVENN